MSGHYPNRAREQLLHMLVEAAELEHSALCAYLFAAYSLKRGSEEGLAEDELETVTEWRKTLIQIARDEMAHLVTVNNLIVAIGGSAHFNRPNFPVAPNYFPGRFTLRLMPFGEAAIDGFLALEQCHDRAEPAAEDGLLRGAPEDYLFPAALAYASIGDFYEELKAALRAAAAALGEAALFVGRRGQLTSESAMLPNCFVIVDLPSAEKALDRIVMEGEGSSGGDAEGHYARFSRMRDQFAAHLARNPDFSPARPVADSPVMRRPAPGHEAEVTHVSAAPAAAVLDAANALYGQILRFLLQAYRHTRAEAQARDVRAAVLLMDALTEVSTHLTTLPAADGADAHAGISFTMLRSIEPLSHRDEGLVARERLEEIARRIGALAPSRATEKAVAKVREAALPFAAIEPVAGASGAAP